MQPPTSRAGSRSHFYASCLHVKKSIGKGEGLSGIIAEKRLFFLVECKSKNVVEMHELIFDDMHGVARNNTHFCPVKISKKTGADHRRHDSA